MAVSRTRKKRKNQTRPTPMWEGRTVVAAGEGAAAGGPSSRSLEVGKRAAESDRVWFDMHPSASVRVREALPGEHDHQSFRPEPLAPNEKVAVVVVQVTPGRRTRIPFQVITTPTASVRISRQQLEEVRAEWESSDQTPLMTNSRGQAVDALAMFRRVMTRDA
ncbi:hypothetical protein [Streptomyces sp. G1]|uniref:hypothetical protein n=1 Tax=Streptomyces sp. G1 TaxID=361572 RepID=UPI002030858B|nr:hypothetical protein [Streptomyces sp. G1]MCM1969423.1 hypothetical protein [Streptomyces sp. G1]